MDFLKVCIRRWAAGDTTIGAWLTYREPLLAEIAALAGYDYVCIDVQHGLMDLDTATAMLASTARTDTVPMARVPWNEPGIIGRMLDGGALAIVVPMVNSADEARRAVESCRYSPIGSRSFGPSLPNNRYGPTYPSRANDEVTVIPMIETREALANLHEIVSVPGVDAVYIGPADLSIALGHQVGHALLGAGLTVWRERSALDRHESGQPHVAIYSRNRQEHIEALISCFSARAVPLNVNYRYLAAEVRFLFDDASVGAVVFASEFAPIMADVIANMVTRPRLLVQIADESGHPLLGGAQWFDALLAGQDRRHSYRAVRRCSQRLAHCAKQHHNDRGRRFSSVTAM